MPGAPRSHLSTTVASAPAPSTGFGYLFGSPHKEATYLHGIHGRESLSADEGKRGQATRRKRGKECTVGLPCEDRFLGFRY